MGRRQQCLPSVWTTPAWGMPYWRNKKKGATYIFGRSTLFGPSHSQPIHSQCQNSARGMPHDRKKTKRVSAHICGRCTPFFWTKPQPVTTQPVPVQHPGCTSAAPELHQLCTGAAPAQHLSCTSSAPAQRQLSTRAAPEQHQCGTSAAPGLHLSSTSAAPEQHQGCTSAAPGPVCQPFFCLAKPKMACLLLGVGVQCPTV